MKLPIGESWREIFANRACKGRQTHLRILEEVTTGKTNFARALGRHVTMIGVLDSKQIHDNCQIVHFDDVDITRFAEYRDFMNSVPLNMRSAYPKV